MQQQVITILFICTHNRCRSILAEAIANHYGEGRIQAFSAGSSPAGKVHPLTLHYLKEHKIPSTGLKSQSWDEFEDKEIDLVITVCDKAANETCPLWFTQARQEHWGLTDPSSIEGNDEDIAQAFKNVIDSLKKRIKNI